MSDYGISLDRVIALRNRKTVYRDGNRCIKVFDAAYSKADVLNEALNQARIEETGLHIPRVLEVSMVDGKWAIVSEYIKGKTLAQLMETAEASQQSGCLELLVKLQREVHGKACPMLVRLKDKLRRQIGQASLDAALQQALLTRLEELPDSGSVCHGDFTPSNVIVPEDDSPYILDWSHATQGSPAADAAWSYLLLCLNAGAETGRRYLDLFCGKSRMDKTCVQAWIPVVAAAQSIKGSAGEREFLLSWVHAMDCQ